jgi:hypothetical protein
MISHILKMHQRREMLVRQFLSQAQPFLEASRSHCLSCCRKRFVIDGINKSFIAAQVADVYAS